MVKVKPIEEILRCILASGKLKDERPLSAILIAKIECGKTEMMRKHFLKSENVFYTTDATAHGIIRDTNQLRDFSSRCLTHIVIPDLLTCIGRKQATVKTFIHFMNALVEEGVVNISTYANNLKGDVEARAGFITAIPPEPFRDKRHGWAKIGFLSRALPISFDYKVKTRVKIFRYIQEQEHLSGDVSSLDLPKKPKLIELPLEMAKAIEPYSRELASQHSEYSEIYGFRYQKQLQAFVKAIALLEGKDKVDGECIEKFGKLADFINFEMNKI